MSVIKGTHAIELLTHYTVNGTCSLPLTHPKRAIAILSRTFVIVLFQQERITLGRASLLCGMDQIEFQKLLASRAISIHYDIEDYEADLKSIREDGW